MKKNIESLGSPGANTIALRDGLADPQMPTQTAKPFAKYLASTFAPTLVKATDIYTMIGFLACIGVIEWKWNPPPVVVRLAFCVFVYCYSVWLCFRRHENQQKLHESEKKDLQNRIDGLEAEKKAREADTPRLEIVFDNKKYTSREGGQVRWSYCIGVKNTSASAQAERVELKIKNLIPTMFSEKLPASLRLKGEYGPKPGILDKLGPHGTVLFDLLDCDQYSNIGFRTTAPLGPDYVKLNDPAAFPNGEWEASLEASSANCLPVQGTLKVRWARAEVEVEWIPRVATTP